MRASIVVSSFLVAGALGKPINHDNAAENAIVWKTVTVNATNIASGSIPSVTVSEAIKSAKSVTELAIIVPPSETLGALAVHYRHQHNWRTQIITTSAPCIASTISIQTDSSATQAATTAISRFIKIHTIVTGAPLLSKASSNATVSSQEPVFSTHISTPSFGNASPTSKPLTASDEASASIPTVPTPTPENIPKPVNHSQDQTLEEAEIAESDGSPYSDGVHLLTTINKWRKIYKLPLLRWSHQLELNALKTGTHGDGRNQIHQLNEGTMAQVITPGMSVKYGSDLGGDTPFELSYVAWLCESSSDIELKSSDGKDQCKLVDDNLHMMYSDKGHYNILTSKGYTNIGCAFADDPNVGNNTPYQGLWVCDLN